MTRSVLITGGGGDLAAYLSKCLASDFEVLRPSRNELDVTSIDSVTAYLKDVPVDILLNNAGTLHPGTITEIDPEDWIRDVQVNLIGTFLVSRSVLLSNQEARVLNISSTAAFNAYRDWSSYCCSKAAVVTFTKCLASDGYDAYCLCPGAIATKFRAGMTIDNPRVMTLEEAAMPVLAAVRGEYEPGDVVFYRKGELITNPGPDIA